MKENIQELAYMACRVLEEYTSLSVQDLEVSCGMTEKETFLVIGWLMHSNKIVYDVESNHIYMDYGTEELDLAYCHTYSMT